MVSSYNHNTLGSEEKPLIPNIELKILIEKMNEGNLEAYAEALQKWSFESFQKQFLQNKFNEIKNAKK